MKQINKLFLWLATGVLLAASCGKDTAVAPKTTKSSLTITSSNNQPAVGPTSPTGGLIYSGTTPPDGSVGIDGDYYLDKNTGLFYGPKISGAWGTPFSLIGPRGYTGAAGNSVLSGSGAPASTLGKTGDFYIDITTDNFYGPKTTAGGWGSATPLVGQRGLTGAAGATILSGTGAPASTLGKTGDFYLDLATYNLYGPKTTSGGWGTGNSLKGYTGAAGATILSGTGAPAASLGKTGDFYLDKGSFLFYGPKTTAGGWGTPTSLQGPAGTANVQYSSWQYAGNPRDSTIDGSALHLADLAAPALSQNIIDAGVVQVYFRLGTNAFVLPYTSFAGGKESTISFLPRLKRIIITRFTADNTNSIPLSTALQYRYVLIPGGVSLGAIKNAHIDMSDYNAVAKFLQIKD